MSWNNEMANADRPWRVVSWRRSASSCRMNAVEFIDNATPTTIAAGSGNPNPNATAPMTIVVAPTCAAPRPKTVLRNTHRRDGCSSRPMMNSSSTTPSSAKPMVLSTSVTRRRPQGPMTRPAARNPSTAPSLSRLNSGTRTTAAARKTKASVSSVTRRKGG